ncbi:translation initiation factor eIF-1A [Candidatus Woesearchaeota archaeon]|nr:translation initiation factor eIF-1A [Candidatus Woesearchaeota archaeon]
MAENEEVPIEGTEGSEEVLRVRLPRDKQVLGLCERRLGGSRMKVICLDGKTRVCRIPGRLKRILWVRDGDTLLIEPWEFSGDGKGDVVYKYRPLQVQWLKKNGYLKGLEDLEEF